MNITENECNNNEYKCDFDGKCINQNSLCDSINKMRSHLKSKNFVCVVMI